MVDMSIHDVSGVVGWCLWEPIVKWRTQMFTVFTPFFTLGPASTTLYSTHALCHGPGAATPLRELTGMMVTARVADLGRAQRAPLEMRAAGEKIASFEPFFKGGKQNFEDYFLQPWPATSAFCSQCWS